MTTPYVCASCRRQLIQRSARSSSRLQLASYSNDPSKPLPSELDSEDASSSRHDARSSSRSRARVVPQQVERFAQVVEEDFVRRLQEARLGTDEEWGPYSTPKPPRSRAARLDALILGPDDTKVLPTPDTRSSKPSSKDKSMILSNMSIGRGFTIRRREAALPAPQKDTKPPITNTIGFSRIPRVYRTRVRFAPPLDIHTHGTSNSSTVSQQFALMHETSTLHSSQPSQTPPAIQPSKGWRQREPRRNARPRGTGISHKPSTFDQWMDQKLSKHNAVIRDAHLQQGLPFTHVVSAAEKNTTFDFEKDPTSDFEKDTTSDIEKGKSLLSEAFLYPVYDHVPEIDLNMCATSAENFHQVALEALAGFCQKWAKKELPASCPTPSKLLEQLNKAAPEIPWIDSWLSAMQQVLSVATHKARSSSSANVKRLRPCLSEIHSLWKHFLDCHRGSHPLAILSRQKGEWTWSPVPFRILNGIMDTEPAPDTIDFSERWSRVFPPVAISTDDAGTIEAMAALTGVHIRIYNEAMGKDLNPYLTALREFMGRIIHGSNLESKVDHYTALLKPILNDEDSTFFARTQLRVLSKGYPRILGELPDNAHRPDNSRVDEQVNEFVTKMGQAIQQTHVPRFHQLWSEARATYNASNVHGQFTIPMRMYAHLFRGAVALRMPTKIAEIWDHMAEHGVSPDDTIWDAMLHACWKTRQKEAIDKIWGMMMDTGEQPTGRAWATLITALVKSGSVDSGLQVFRDMAARWLEAARAAGFTGDIKTFPDFRNAPKPPCHALNVLVLSLSRRSRFTELAQLISQASALGIRPDIYTFNPLLKAALMKGDRNLMDRILRQMEAAGVQPDSTTFAVMLDGIFREQDIDVDDEPEAIHEEETHNEEETADPDTTSSPASSQAMKTDPDTSSALADQRQTAILHLFETMEAKGLKPDAWTFSALINGLLQSQHPNIEAAYAVLRFMRENEYAASSAIYTSLISYHFSRPIPDIAAIDALWERARRSTHLDTIFYDRLIEGFSKIGEVGKAAAAMTQASQKYRRPGWIALREYVRALVQAGDWGRAEELVFALKYEEDKIGGKAREKHGKEQFWQMVKAYRLDRAPTTVAAESQNKA